MAHTAQLCPEIPLATWTRSIRRSALQEMLSAASRPGVISFALGLPAPELFPVKEYGQALESVLMADPRVLQYGPASREMKSHVVDLMAQRGVVCLEEQVFMTAGAQQGMSLLARLLLNQGSQVIVEELTYTGFQQILEPYEPQLIAVPTDGETGMDVEAVEAQLRGGARPAFIYAISDGHNPLGASMQEAKRRYLVDLARQYHVPILEDDAYGFLHYGEKLLPPLRSLDDQWVFYIGSFSKVLAPALRVGWIVAPEFLMPKLSIIKEASDIDTGTLPQRAVAAYIAAGHLPGHIAVLRDEYRLRRDAMQKALESHFPREARWTRPASGLFFWVELPEGTDTDRLLPVALETEDVAFIPGSAFYVGHAARAKHCLRLNFSNSSIERIEEGIRRLARVLEGAA